MRRVADKAGFRFEGILRGFWKMPDGSARDYAMYARTRADHEADHVAAALNHPVTGG